MIRNKLNKELKYGVSIIGLYIFWSFAWMIYKYFIKGSISIPYNPEINLEFELVKPFSQNFILGADLLGRSLFEVLSAGLSYSLIVALIVTFLTSCLGIIIGYLSVKGPNFVKIFFDLLINIIFIFPSILIAIMVMAVTGQSVIGLIFALVITGWPGYAKIARGETKRILNLSYVESAKAIGTSDFRLFYKIIIPALMPIMIVNMVLGISGVIISEAALGFLGLGGSVYSWGALLSTAKTVLLEAPHVAIVLSLTMSGLIIGLNLLGDGLRDYLDPKSS
jgi:ABC-type dipeptide/oligopeptide/nickel transport system permease subunit